MIAETPARGSRRSQHLFYVGMSLVAVVTVFAGFARTYFLRPYFHPEPLTLLVRIHGLIFTAWIVLFVAQTTLVAAHRTDIHRRLGWAGGALAALMIVVVWLTAVTAVHQAVLTGNAVLARAFFAIPLGDIVVFGTLVGAAVFYRRRPETHKRLMLAYDVLTRRKLERAYAWGVTLVIGMQILRELVGPTATWQSFARVFAG